MAYISKGVLPLKTNHFSYSQSSESYSRDTSPEGLIVRYRTKITSTRRKRTLSEAEQPPSPVPSYSGPVIKPKKSKSTLRNKSLGGFKPLGPVIEANLPGDSGRNSEKSGKLGRYPTTLMLKLVKSHTNRHNKVSPSLTLVNLEGPAEGVQSLPVRIMTIRPRYRPRFRARGGNLEEKTPVCHMKTLSIDANFKGNSLEKVVEPVKPSVRRKVVFIKKEEEKGEDLDPDYDHALSSYYL